MGTTDVYGLSYPEPDDLVKDGAAAIQGLAETTEAGLLAPLLMLQGTADDADHADGRVTWNTGTPLKTRGVWTFPATNKRVIPAVSGYYLVAVQVPFTATSGIDPTIRFRLIIGTRKTGDTDTLPWATTISTQQSISDPGPTLTVSTVVECNDPGEGIEVVAENVGRTSDIAGSAGSRLRIHQLSRVVL